MKASHWLERVSPSLRRLGLAEHEIFLRQGRSRRFEVGPQGVLASQSSESGWAIRATGERTSLFVAGTDEPPAEGPWPAPDGYPIQLPAHFAGQEWSEPPDLDAPLMVEGEALELLEACARELEREMPGARLLHAVLEDGASSSAIASSQGVDAAVRARTATLYLEAAAPGSSNVRVTEFVAEREARRFSPRSLGRRLTDRLVVRTRGAGVSRDRAPCLLAPQVTVRVLAGLLPLLVGPEAASRARSRADRQGRLANEKVTVVDDPLLPEGLFCGVVDGEGVPTRRLVLVEEGVFRRALVGWWQVEPRAARPAGCLRRPSWKEPPRVGPSHLYIEPDRSVAVHTLLEAIPRGYYFLEGLPGAEFDLSADRFSLPVCGFQVSEGRASQPVSKAILRGRIGAFLHGVQGVARDLTFFPAGSALGGPSLLVHGLEIAPD